MADETTSRQTFYIHNTSRDPKKRDQRRQAVGPDRSRLNIRIAGIIEVRRGRPLQVGEIVLRRHLKELIELERKGLVEVYDHRSQRVDLLSIPTAVRAAVDPNKAKAEAARARREESSLIRRPEPEAPPPEPEPTPEPPPEPEAPEPEPEPEVEAVADTVPPPPPLEEVEEEVSEEADVVSEETSSQGSTSRRSKKRRR